MPRWVQLSGIASLVLVAAFVLWQAGSRTSESESSELETSASDATRERAARPTPATAPTHDTAQPSAGAAGPVPPDKALRHVRQLVNDGTIGLARATAERYLRELPDCPEAREIMSLTGVHPHP